MQLREILEDIEATIPEARERHADKVEFFAEVRSMVLLAVLSVSAEDKDWIVSQV